MMGVSESGLRLAMLDTLRGNDEAALQRAIAQLEHDMEAKATADALVANDLRTIKTLRARIADTTQQMNRIVERTQPCLNYANF